MAAKQCISSFHQDSTMNICTNLSTGYNYNFSSFSPPLPPPPHTQQHLHRPHPSYSATKQTRHPKPLTDEYWKQLQMFKYRTAHHKEASYIDQPSLPRMPGWKKTSTPANHNVATSRPKLETSVERAEPVSVQAQNMLPVCKNHYGNDPRLANTNK